MSIIANKVSFQAFIESGDFLTLTLQEPETAFSHAPIEWPSCRATLIDAGVLLLEPKKAGAFYKHPKGGENRNIIISCGVHGNETAPIEIVNQLVKDICLGQLHVGSRLMLIIGNPLAMTKNERFIDENLNRLFKEKSRSEENLETIRAKKLMAYLKCFFGKNDNTYSNIHYDLHTAIRASVYEKFAIYPYQGDKPWSKEQLSFLQSSGINTVLFSHAPAGTFSYYSSNIHDADAFTIELGQVRDFGKNDMSNFSKLFRNLRSLIQGDTVITHDFNAEEFNLFTVCHEIMNTSGNFEFYIDKNIKNFTTFPLDTLLSEDGDNHYRTQHNGEAIVFPNPNVPVGQRVALLIKPTKIQGELN